jgi:hypothetical protein
VKFDVLGVIDITQPTCRDPSGDSIRPKRIRAGDSRQYRQSLKLRQLAQVDQPMNEVRSFANGSSPRQPLLLVVVELILAEQLGGHDQIAYLFQIHTFGPWNHTVGIDRRALDGKRTKTSARNLPISPHGGYRGSRLHSSFAASLPSS